MTQFIRLFSVLLMLGFVSPNPSCPKSSPGMLTVHLVCHTHNDVGWLKTVDQYYYGANNTIQRAGVQYILDSVIQELLKDSSRMFSYVESAFFYRWWAEQSQDIKEVVKSLVASGQLELVNGGWCMNDEAAAHYSAIIDQMTLGLRFLNETFGNEARPRVAWQVDPFGHSSGQASIFAQMGFDGLFFGRLDFADKEKRWNERNMETIWFGSQSLGEAASLFTGVLPNNYSPPKGFCFDDLCADTPIMDDPSLEDYNVDEMVDKFIETAEDQAKAYRSNNIIMTMGEDFNYQNANTWYKNLDKLIKYVNARQSQGSKINVVYSTPSCYLDSVHDDDLAWSTKTDDFFPYASDPHAYWTGYFSSRPSLKGTIRKSNALLQAIKKYISIITGEISDDLMKQMKAVAVAQHHDAVTGTAKQHVTDDYVKRLSDAFGIDEDWASFCNEKNISSCVFTESKESFYVQHFNPLARFVSKYIRFPVMPDTNFEVKDRNGSTIPSQMVPIPKMIMNIPYRNSTATHELVFLAANIPPLGVNLYLIQKTHDSSSVSKEVDDYEDVGFDQLKVTVDQKTGRLTKARINTGETVKNVEIALELLYYPGMAGNNTNESLRASGAYIFRPNGTKAFPLGIPDNIVYDGPLVKEIHQSFASWGSLIIKLYKTFNHVEIDWVVGSIPVEDKIGKEVILRYKLSDINNSGTFFTDANGREMQKRVLNYRPTWDLNITEPIAGNYYPVTSKITIGSENQGGQVAILTDRSQGGTSLNSGEIELMVHRRLLFDDAFGVGEALNEIEFGEGLIVRGTHLLVHSATATPDCSFVCQHTRLAEEMFIDPLTLFSDPSLVKLPTQLIVQGLTEPLPEQVNLLTLEPTGNSGELLLRLEHLYEKDSDPQLSVPVTVNLETLLSDWRITEASETVLSANQFLKDSNRLQWTVAKNKNAISKSDVRLVLQNSFPSVSFAFDQISGEDIEGPEEHHPNSIHGVDYQDDTLEDLSVTLQPFQIRTFIVKIQPK